ncbi:hypothetical protein LINPERHAP1_LOCUS30814 [Linum perenne]
MQRTISGRLSAGRGKYTITTYPWQGGPHLSMRRNLSSRSLRGFDYPDFRYTSLTSWQCRVSVIILGRRLKLT